MGSGGSSTTFATMSGWPSSRAEVTANSAAPWSKGTLKKVARRTGLLSPRDLVSGDRRRPSCVVMSLGVQLPAREVAHPLPHPAAPARHVKQVPPGHDDREQQQKPLRHKKGEEPERHAEHEGRPDGAEPEPAHLPHDPPVLVGRDLTGIPPAAARAAPGLPVGEVVNFATVTLHRDACTFHYGNSNDC